MTDVSIGKGTYSDPGIETVLMPLGGMQAGAIANVLGAHWALVIGGLDVVLFALGPAALNPKVRNLTALVSQFKAKP